MTQICPTITAENPHTYREQFERVTPLSQRIHVDFADGEFAPRRLLTLDRAWLPDGSQCDLHVMFKDPEQYLERIISLMPSLVIFHAEAQGDIGELFDELASVGIQTGLALLPETDPEDRNKLIQKADHVLIFGGKLGYHGGEADLTQLNKVSTVREIKSTIEIAWDGGVNVSNARLISAAGVDVLNVGSFIHSSDNPQAAYDILVSEVQ